MLTVVTVRLDYRIDLGMTIGRFVGLRFLL